VAIPTITARAMHYYRSSGFPGSQVMCGLFGFGCQYGWIYSADPAFPAQIDDTDHGAYEIAAMGLLWRNEARLDAMLSPLGDSIALTQTDLANAGNTFVQKIGPANRGHLYQKFDGTVASPVDAYDESCAGWLELAPFNPNVFSQCQKVLLATWNPSLYAGMQPYPTPVAQLHLSAVTHAALLAAKARLPAP
jgi:hypothetical protein